jgi:hypothetical protein
MARRRAVEAVSNAPDGWVVVVTPSTRSHEQNAALWALLDTIAKTVDWYGQHLTTEEWKDVFTAALHRQKVVPGIDGGFVVCGQRTSQMNKKDFSDLLEVINAFAASKGIELICYTEPTGRPAA